MFEDLKLPFYLFKVYLSEFGKQRLAEEDLSGPKELKEAEENEMESGDLNNLEVRICFFTSL